jgi:hypothetical protein
MTIRPPGQEFCRAACQVACDAFPQAELELGEHGSQKCAEFGRRVNYPSTKKSELIAISRRRTNAEDRHIFVVRG